MTDPIILQRKSPTHNYYIRLAVKDLTSGVTLSNFEIRDAGTDPVWQTFSTATVKRAGSADEFIVYQFSNTLGRAYVLPFDVRFTSTGGVVLTVDDLVTAGSNGDTYDTGVNFVSFTMHFLSFFLFFTFFGVIKILW